MPNYEPFRTYTWNNLQSLSGLLQQIYNSGIPGNVKNRLRQNFEFGLNQQYNDAQDTLQQNFASNGLRGSGVLSAALSNLYGKKAQAETQFGNNLAQMDWQARQNALGQLMGLREYMANLVENRVGSDRQNQQFYDRLNEMIRQFNEQMNVYRQANSFGNTILPALLGAGANILTGYWGTHR